MAVSFADENNGIISGTSGVIVKTTDGGLTWNLHTTLTSEALYSIDYITPNNAVAVGSNGTILSTINGGETWSLQTIGVTKWLYGISLFDSNNGWAVGDYGTILHTTNGGVTFIENEENNFTQPKEFLLQQNYPNPFNPSTNIQYSISTTQFVTIKVYDILGNEIATLVNDYKPAGTYEVTFNASKLSSGIYFYKLQSGNFVQTRKMILLK